MTDTAELEQIEKDILAARIAESSWHLDKKVPLAVIVTILIQTSAIIWFGAQLATRVAHLEKVVVEHTKSLEIRKVEDNKRGNRITALESFHHHIERQLNKIDFKLDRLLPSKTIKE